MSRPFRPSRPRAFSLIELLVVLAIIALLLGLLVPTLGHVRHSARTAACLTNLRMLQQAHWMYIAEESGRFIRVGLPHGGVTDESVSWIETLEPYVDGEPTLRSALDTSPHWAAEDGGEGVPVPGTTERFRRTSYGCNNYVTQYSPAADQYGDASYVADRIGRVKQPASTVHFVVMVYTDAQGFCGADHVHVENWRMAPPVLAAAQMQTDAVGGKARTADARSNYGFLDGHVETLPFSAVYVDPDHNRFDPEVSATWR